MENFVSNSSVVLGYEDGKYQSVTGQKYLNNKYKRWDSYTVSFCDFLADTFMECQFGIQNLYYDFTNDEALYIDINNHKIRFMPQRGASRVQIRKI